MALYRVYSYIMWHIKRLDNQSIADDLGVISGTFLNYIIMQKLSYFRTSKKRHKTLEINTRRKSKRPKKQRKTKDISGGGCGGLDGGNCMDRVGWTAEDLLMYGRSIKAPIITSYPHHFRTLWPKAVCSRHESRVSAKSVDNLKTMFSHRFLPTDVRSRPSV